MTSSLPKTSFILAKNPLSFFRILLITHSFHNALPDYLSRSSPLSQTILKKASSAPITDGVCRLIFSLPNAYRKRSEKFTDSFITWRHTSNLHFIRMLSSAPPLLAHRGHSLEQREQQVQGPVSTRSMKNQLWSRMLDCFALRVRPSSTWTQVTGRGGS